MSVVLESQPRTENFPWATQSPYLSSRCKLQLVFFCEENTPDGSYRELLSMVRATSAETRFIVVLSTSEWEGYFNALRLGAANAIAVPLQAADVETILLHALRGDLSGSFLRATA